VANTLSGDEIDGVLIDIDGVLTVSWEPIDGASDALATIRRSSLPLRFATNTTTRTRAEVAELLGHAGMPVEVDEILTAPAATAAHLRRQHPGARVFLLNTGDLTADLADIDLVDHGPADVVVIGGAGVDFTHQQLNQAFRLILDGAAFVAMHRNMYWRTSGGLELDTGAYVQALEAATGVEPVVVGKPSPDFFTAGVTELACEPGRVAMIGDDLDNDVLGARRAGLRGVLVRTGKFRQAVLDASREQPDAVIDSFAELPDLLGLR
jgi:HAD superfamily hydrolase (TIGR01458 family)